MNTRITFSKVLALGLCALTASGLALAQGGPGMGGPPSGPPGRGDFPISMPGMSGRDADPPRGARAPDRLLPPREAPPEFPGRNPLQPAVPLSEAVSMVQQRFNATAVKTEAVSRSGQLVYRIRLLSADKSRVWTVDVDARTGAVY